MLLKVFVGFFIIPILAPELLVEIACDSSHRHIDIGALVVYFELLKIVIFFEKLVSLFLLFLVFQDGCSHFAL